MPTSTQKHAVCVATTKTQPLHQGLRWVSLVTHLDPRYGGLSAAVPQLAGEIATRAHVSMELAAFCTPGEIHSAESAAEWAFSEWPSGRLQWWRDRALQSRLDELVRRVDGVHLHGLWEQSTEVGARSARRLGVPYIVSAHGMLERWALQQKKWKKKVYTAMVGRAILEGAACLHALTVAEAEDYRRQGCTAPIAVIPNGVRTRQQVTSTTFFRHHPTLRGKRIVLFLGRIHPKKGLDLLVRAWTEVANAVPDAVLVLAGPDEDGTRARVESLIKSAGLTARVCFTGMLRGEIKWSALAAAECFVLPSFSEGLSVSVLEAMGMGLPVIVSRQCNLPEIEDVGAGWVVSTEDASLAQALGALLSRTNAERHAMGANGERFVRDRYNWASVAEKMAALYRWVAGTGPAPDSLYRQGISALGSGA